jgi:hypothetical protein
MTTTDQMTISGPLFVILLIHWEVVKWICSLFLGHLAISSWQEGLWLRRLNNSPVFAPSLGHKSNTPLYYHRPDDRLRTTVCHSFDPLGGGEMDLQFILGSFGHWQEGLWLRRLNNSPVFAPSLCLSFF